MKSCLQCDTDDVDDKDQVDIDEMGNSDSECHDDADGNGKGDGDYSSDDVEVVDGNDGAHDDANDRKACRTCAVLPAHLNDPRSIGN